MKITVDELTFNKAIKDRKFELAEWLIEQNCPYKSTVYLQNLEIDTLNWLYDKHIPVDSNIMSSVIEITSSADIIQWFIEKGVKLDESVVNSCIRTKDITYIKWFLNTYNVKLSPVNYEIAIVSENIPVLNLLKTLNCPYDNSITEKALKYSKKKSIKWLVKNDMFNE